MWTLNIHVASAKLYLPCSNEQKSTSKRIDVLGVQRIRSSFDCVLEARNCRACGASYLRCAVRVGNTVLVVRGSERHIGAGVDGGDISGVDHGDVEQVRRVVINGDLSNETPIDARFETRVWATWFPIGILFVYLNWRSLL